MSTTIDQQVVEMRFDNKQFESNVSTTMSTLDKLKQKLQFDGASKGLENVNSAARKVDMSVLSNGAEAVRVKFSALEVAGVTALANITNSAVNTGKNLVKSLSIDQIASGWKKYGDKTGSVQTIMNATGLSIDEVNQYLDKLMWFSDETSYGFTDMTAALGQMTSAGGDIKKLIPLITGVANATAFAGKGASEFTRVMYNLNQSYSKGYLDYADWKSIDLAGASSKQLKQMIIDVAVAQGKIKETDVDLANFASTLKDKWADTKVLEEAFGKFAEMSEKAYEMVQSGEVDTASEAYEILAQKYDGVAITAAKAAQEAKTFSEAIDATKDAVSSGWMRTFELIFGNYSEAKVMWTDLANILWDMFASGAEDRNEFLYEALESNWDKLIKKINTAGITTEKFEKSIQEIVGDKKLSELIEKYGSLEEVIKNGAVSSDDLKKALADVAGTGLAGVVDGLKEIDRLLSRGSTGEDVKKLQTALKELGYELGSFGKNKDGIDGVIGSVTQKAIKEFQKANGLVVDGIAGPKTLAALEKAAAEIQMTTEEVDELMASCDSLIDVIADPGGREYIFETIINLLEAIQRPLGAVGEAFSNVFSLTPENLYNGLKKINQFSKSLISGGILDAETWEDLVDRIGSAGIETTDFTSALSEALKENGVNVDELTKKYGSLGKAFEDGAISTELIRDVLLSFDGISETLVDSGGTIDKIRRTFEGLFAAIDLVATVLSGPLKIVWKTITAVLKKFGLGILDVTANVGDSIVEFRNNVDGVITAISDFIAEHVTKWIEKFEETEIFKNVAGWFSEAGEKISGVFDGISGKVDKFNLTPIGKGLQAVAGFITDTAKTIGKSKIFGLIKDGVIAGFEGLKSFFSAFKLPKFSLEGLKTFFSNIVTIGDNIAGSGKTGIAGVVSGFGSFFKTKFVTPKWTAFLTKVEEFWSKFLSFWIDTGDAIKKAFEVVKDIGKRIGEFFKSVTTFIFGTDKFDLSDILAVLEKILMLKLMFSAINALETLVSPFDNITNALNNFASSLKWDAIAGAFKSMALVLGVLTVCIVVISQIPDMKKAWQAFGMLAGLMVIMAGVMVALGFLANKLGGFDISSVLGLALSLLALAAAIAIMVYAVKEIDNLKLKNPGSTFLTLGLVLLALTAGIRMVGKAAGASAFKAIAAILTLLIAMKQILEVLDLYDQYDWAGKSKAIWRMASMMGLLSGAIAIMGLGRKGDSSLKGVALSLLAMVISLKLMLSAIDEIATKSDEDISRGLKVIAALMGIMAAFVAIANLTSKGQVVKKGEKSINNFAGLAIALLAVVGAIWLLGSMDIATLEQGGKAVAQILVLFTGMLAVLGKSCSGLKTGPIIAMMIMIAVLMAEMAIITKALDAVSWQSKVSTAASLGALLLAMAFIMRSVSAVDVKVGTLLKWVGMLAVLSGVIMVLSQVLKNMSGVNGQHAIGQAIALGVLLLAMSGVLHILKTLDMRKFSTSKIQKLAGIFAGLVIIIWALSVVLSSMNNIDGLNAINNVVALGTMLIAMSGVLYILTGLKTTSITPSDLIKIGAALLGLTVITAAVGAVLWGMSELGVTNALENVAALSLMLIVLTGVMAVCGAMGGVVAANAVGFAYAVIGLGGLVLVVGALGNVLSGLKDSGIAGMMDDVKVLSTMLIVLTAVMAICAAMGIVATYAGVGMAAAIGAMFVLAALVGAIGEVLYTMKDYGIAGMMDDVKVLSTMLIVLTAVMAVCTLIGFAAVPAIAGVGVLILFIGALVELITRIGDIMSDSKLQEFLDTGIETLKKLATGLGEMISNFGVAVTAKLPEIGQNLSDFATSLEGFITVMKSIDDTVVNNASKLVEAIAVLTASDFMDGLNNLFKKADEPSSLEVLGKELSGFASNAGGFISAFNEMKPETATSIESFCNAVESLNAVCGDNNFGDGALTALGDNMKSFSVSMKSVSESLSDFTDEDVAAIQRASTAASALATLNEKIPKSGGLWQDIAGEGDLAEWGKKINAFADSLINYSIKVSGKSIDKQAILDSAEAATGIADLNNKIPSSDGALQYWAGEADLADWGRKIVAFGKSLVAYSSLVSGKTIDAAAIKASCDAAKEIAGLNDAIPESDGVWQWITGEKDLSTFGTGLVDLADGLLQYAQKAVQIQSIGTEPITHTGTLIDEIRKVCEKIPEIGFDWGNGIKDPGEFGAGINTLADGLYNFCMKAVSLNALGQSALNGITFAGTAISNVVEVVRSIPEDIDNMKSSGALHTAVSNLSGVCRMLNEISTSGYDYSGVETIKTAIGNIKSIVADESFDALLNDLWSLKDAINNTKSVGDTLVSLNDNSYGGVAVLKSALSDLAKADVDGVIATFEGKASSIENAVKGMVAAMIRGIESVSSKTNITNAMIALVDAGIDAISNKKDDYHTEGTALGSELASGLETKDTQTKVKSAGKSLADEGVTGARDKRGSMESAGEYLGSGLVVGMNNRQQAVYDAGYALGQKAAQGVEDGEEAASPSKRGIQAGKWLGEGLVIGIDEMGKKVYSSGHGLGETATNALSSTISRISDLVNSDIDSQPTIRPVLDLSDVQSGASALSSLFGGNSIGVHTNLGAISSMMNSRSQNGVNDDVVAAIDKLNKKMDNIQNASYTINGVTYDDGSNISDAVATLVRAAKIERRV